MRFSFHEGYFKNGRFYSYLYVCYFHSGALYVCRYRSLNIEALFTCSNRASFFTREIILECLECSVECISKESFLRMLSYRLDYCVITILLLEVKPLLLFCYKQTFQN
jgi:hypothetical protein